MLTKLIIKKTPADETFLSQQEGDQWSRRRRRVSRYANQFHPHAENPPLESSAL